MTAITSHRGFNHLGFATHNLEKTREFYEGVLGFKVMIADIIKVEEGGQLRHLFFDAGRDQLIAFMEATGLDGVSDDFDTSINGAVNVPTSFFHFAFEGGSIEHMKDIRSKIVAKGVEISEIIDHGQAHSMYFKDPVNGLALEYCAWVRPFTVEGAIMKPRYELPIAIIKDPTAPRA